MKVTSRLLAAAAVLAAAACTDRPPTVPAAAGGDAPRRATGCTPGGGCDTGVTIEPSTPYLRQSSLSPVYEGPITITFSRPVKNVAVSGSGAVWCLGNVGTLVGYDSAGTEVARQPLTLIAPSDCGEDNVTFGAQATITATIRKAVIEPPSPFQFQFTLDGTVYNANTTAEYSLTYDEAGAERPSFVSVSARGPNPDSSFTTLAGENVLALHATLSDPSFAGQVQWKVEDDPADQVASPAVSVTGGADATGRVGAVQNPTGRWPGHPGRLDQKALRYRVRAFLVLDGDTVFSQPATAVQSEEDVMRQEYVDFGSLRQLIPTQQAFSHAVPSIRGVQQSAPATGLGDYCVPGGAHCTVLVNPRLAQLTAWVESRWTGQLRVNSIYRNPVHHHTHPGVTGGNTSRNDSPHKYGTAIDYQAFPTSGGPQQKLYWSALRNVGLTYPGGSVCAETYYLKNPQTGKDVFNGSHVHFDRRDAAQRPCPDVWKRPAPAAPLLRPDLSAAGAADGDLLGMLRSADWTERQEAAALLAEMDDGELPQGYGAAALAQLRDEIALARADGQADDQEYPAYLLDLVRVVHRAEDPAAADALAEMGIETSLGVRSFVAHYPAQSIPGLERSWAAETALHADVFAAYGEMRVLERGGQIQLTPAQSAAVDRALLRAAGADAVARWGLAFFSGQLGLSELTPLVEPLAGAPAGGDDPLGLVAQAAQQSLPALRAAQAALTRRELLARTGRLAASICDGARGLRHGECVALGAHLGVALALDAHGADTAARVQIEVAIRQLNGPPAHMAFTATETALLIGNLQAAAAR